MSLSLFSRKQPQDVGFDALLQRIDNIKNKVETRQKHLASGAARRDLSTGDNPVEGDAPPDAQQAGEKPAGTGADEAAEGKEKDGEKEGESKNANKLSKMVDAIRTGKLSDDLRDAPIDRRDPLSAAALYEKLRANTGNLSADTSALLSMHMDATSRSRRLKKEKAETLRGLHDTVISSVSSFPFKVEPPALFTFVLKYLNLPAYFEEFFKYHLMSEVSCQFFVSLFWYFFCKYFQRQSQGLQHEFLGLISQHHSDLYCQISEATSPTTHLSSSSSTSSLSSAQATSTGTAATPTLRSQQKFKRSATAPTYLDLFFQYFIYTVASALFVGYLTHFPASKTYLTERICAKLETDLYALVNGFEISEVTRAKQHAHVFPRTMPFDDIGKPNSPRATNSMENPNFGDTARSNGSYPLGFGLASINEAITPHSASRFVNGNLSAHSASSASAPVAVKAPPPPIVEQLESESDEAGAGRRFRLRPMKQTIDINGLSPITEQFLSLSGPLRGRSSKYLSKSVSTKDCLFGGTSTVRPWFTDAHEQQLDKLITDVRQLRTTWGDPLLQNKSRRRRPGPMRSLSEPILPTIADFENPDNAAPSSATLANLPKLDTTALANARRANHHLATVLESPLTGVGAAANPLLSSASSPSLLASPFFPPRGASSVPASPAAAPATGGLPPHIANSRPSHLELDPHAHLHNQLPTTPAAKGFTAFLSAVGMQNTEPHHVPVRPSPLPPSPSPFGGPATPAPPAASGRHNLSISVFAPHSSALSSTLSPSPYSPGPLDSNRSIFEY
eukprot:TRINITY_DN9211_c0_g1_i4.p1 TRINITY_DN9211_c0_g1~~TRINITY_DN9211_c0_g1_i4.p1  ORF type:complete len:790 (+),score=155.92 TRINITY_DN9211_c0_g1_i4:143-2512(+)